MPRWPVWAGWRMAATQYTMPVVAAVLSIAGLVGWIRTGRYGAQSGAREREGQPAILFVFFVVAAIAYFRHEHHFRQFAWMLVPSAAAPLARMAAPRRLALLALCALALWPIASALARPPVRDAVRIDTPRGFPLYLRREEVARVEFLNAHRLPGPVLFVPNGTGWLYAYDVERVSRHSWFYSRAVVRPFEEESFSRDVGHAAMIIRCERTDRAWPLPAAAVTLIEQQFTHVVVSAGCSVRTRTTGPAGGVQR
jgi:hypothetical protein